MKFKVGDKIIITSGKDKGKTTTVEKVITKKNLVVAKGVNQYKRHVKGREGIEGGIVTIDRPISPAKIAILDPKSGKPSRIGYLVGKDGAKIRISKKSGQELSAIESKAKAVKPTTKKSATKKDKTK